MRGLTVWPGYRTAIIEIDRQPRKKGQTNYNFRKSAKVAIDGLTSFSLAPLRVALLIGLGSTVILIVLFLAFFLYQMITGNVAINGLLSFAMIITFFFSLNFFTLAIFGEYLGQIHRNLNKRPQYIIDYKLGFGDENEGL